MCNWDQFYTDPVLAATYVEGLWSSGCLPREAIFVEPAAGRGAFIQPLRKLGKVLAFDIKPQTTDIQTADFLLDDCLRYVKGSVVVVGNPPFGFAASKAVKFFNRAARRAEVIAFIVPRTFRKISIQARLDRFFWLVKDEDVPKKAFIKDGVPYDVPCAWQVWERRQKGRPQPRVPDVSQVIVYTEKRMADFCIRRVGGRAGQVLEGTDYSPSSTYFVKQRNPRAKQWLTMIEWATIPESTVGVRSVSKKEIAIQLTDVITRENRQYPKKRSPYSLQT